MNSKIKDFFKMPNKNKTNEPTVTDDLLDSADAAPEGQTVADAIEDELQDYQEAPAEADNDNLVAALEQQIATKDDRHLRLYAEFENFKKRSRREKLDLMDTAGRKTMLSLLPVLDDFDRAAKAAESDEAARKVWESGVGLIQKKLLQTLAGQGLKPMGSNGEVFNADLHEAITEIPHPELAGKVVDTVEKGYTLNDKIIRHAKVVVGKG